MSDIAVKSTKKIGDVEKEAVIYYDFGDNLEEALDKFDETVIFTNFRGAAKITAQGAMRRYLVAGKSPEEIVKLMANWKPGVALERISDPTAAFKAKFMTMTSAEQAAALSDLRDSLKADEGE